MNLRRIEIRNFRKLEAPLVLDHLPDGLVVIAGDNEAGKSTLLEALRAAFFYRHTWTGARVKELQPYESDVRPEVVVDFEIAGQSYRLRKAFCQQRQCELSTPAGAFSGEPAEAELARLLGSPPPGRATERDIEGPLGLLWVQQGGAWASPVSASGSGGLRQLLEREVGDVLGGSRAAKVVERVKQMREELLTPTGKPTGELKKYDEQRARLAARCSELGAKLDQHEALRRELAADLERMSGYRQQQPEFAQRLRAAEKQFADVELLDTRLQGLRAELEHADAQSQLHQEALDRRQRLRRELEQAARDEETRRQARDQASDDARQYDAALRDAVAEVKNSDRLLGAAELKLAGLLAQFKRTETSQRLAGLEDRRQKARAAEAQAREAHAIVASLKMDHDLLARLRQLHEKLRFSELAVQAASTRISLALAADTTAQLDGQDVDDGWSGALIQAARLELASGGIRLATVAVTPATAASAQPAAKLQADQTAWAQTAASAGVADIEAAQLQFERRRQAELNEVAAKNDIARWAPEGLDQLESSVEVSQGELAALPVPDGNLAITPEACAAAETAVADARQCASAAAAQASAALVRFEGGLKLENTCATEWRRADDRRAVRQRELDAALAEIGEESLRQQLAAAQARRHELQQQIQPIGEQIQRLDADQVATRLEMATQAHRNLETEMRELEKRSERQRGELAAAEAWGEELEAAQADRDWADQRYLELRQRADGLQLLHQTLATAQAQAESHFVAPVLRRVLPRLRQLIPDAELAFDNDLNVAGLQRGMRKEPFANLSVGTREQLAILVRLGFAELLRDRGQAAITILDDAPVYADPTRFATMLTILFAAAAQSQILVLTCREQDFRPSGAYVVQLRGCSGGVAGAVSA